jgi:anti-sigma factor RsiW
MPTVLDAYIDGELDADRAAQVKAHTASCQACAAAVEDRRALRDSVRQSELYRPAPASLRGAVLRDLHAIAPVKPASPPRPPLWAWGSLAACVALSAALVWVLVSSRGAPEHDLVVRDAVSSHIRSLMAAHLADVAASDQHTVKPWFAGKLDFSPKVVDFAPDGFPLTGGRLDYVAGRPVAAVVYQRRAHIINLFTCPDTAKAQAARAGQDRGYNAVAWSDGAMRYCAVSDLAAPELMTFAELVQGTKAGPGGQ